jgi:hypothetical protein
MTPPPLTARVLLQCRATAVALHMHQSNACSRPVRVRRACSWLQSLACVRGGMEPGPGTLCVSSAACSPACRCGGRALRPLPDRACRTKHQATYLLGRQLCWFLPRHSACLLEAQEECGYLRRLRPSLQWRQGLPFSSGADPPWPPPSSPPPGMARCDAPRDPLLRGEVQPRPRPAQAAGGHGHRL